MTEQHQTPTAVPHRSARKDVLRALAIIVAVVALVLTSSALNLAPAAAAADGVKKAVIVAGPVHSKTEAFKGYARAIANAAEAHGMETIRIFHPWAPARKVRKLAQGADLFVYVGHGNGWPSPYGPFQEDTKNGLGLDEADKDKRSPSTVVYKGANWLRDNIELAPNAVVILSHLSYASGNASSGMTIPTRNVAIQRVDNYANGFLSIGARVVWALGWQPGADVIDALYSEDSTMEAVFMTRYRDPVNPRNGWIDDKPGTSDSERIPGAKVFIDPHPSAGYLRGLTGDLGFTTTEWRDPTERPPDTVAPEASDLSIEPITKTISTAAVPVFTPNGDGLSDTVRVAYTLSESAFLQVKVKRDGNVVRRTTTWALKGPGKVAWDGRNGNGKYVGEGKYNVYLTPTDRAGNRGPTRMVTVKLLNSIKNPTVAPLYFYARDGDALAATAKLNAKLLRQASVSWLIRDKSGTVVRRAVDGEQRLPGSVPFVWDGKDDDGAWVPGGRYTARVRVQTDNGWYAHDVRFWNVPYTAWTSSWKRTRGETIKMTVTSTEPLKKKPVVTVKQQGVAKYTVPPTSITKVAPDKYRVVIVTRDAGQRGTMAVKVIGTDVDGGTNIKRFTFKLT